MLWIPSACNAADHPSRGHDIPPPAQAPPAWYQAALEARDPVAGEESSIEAGLGELGTSVVDPRPPPPAWDIIAAGGKEALRRRRAGVRGPETSLSTVQILLSRREGEDGALPVCREFFGGGGELTKAWRDAGFPVMPAFETFVQGSPYRGDHDLRRGWVCRREEDRAARGWYAWAHFSPPAGTFGNLYRAGGAGTRTRDRPAGDGTKQKEADANLLWRGMCRIAARVGGKGGGVSVEVPVGCSAVRLPEWELLTRALALRPVCVDLCAYGAGPPASTSAPRAAYRKRVHLWTNIPELLCVARECPGDHIHVRARGGIRVGGRSHRRATLAAVLPPAFCDALVAAATGSTGP